MQLKKFDEFSKRAFYKVDWSILKKLRYIGQKCLYFITVLPCSFSGLKKWLQKISLTEISDKENSDWKNFGLKKIRIKRVFPKKIPIKNIWLVFAQNIFKSKYFALFCAIIFQDKILGLTLRKKFSPQNIWLDFG